VLAVILVAAFMDLLDVTIVAVAAPNIQATLGASPAQVQWLVAAYALALGAALITGGRIGDQYGRRRAFLFGLAVFVATSAACALAPSASILIAARVGQGLGAGLMVPQVFGIIRASLEPRHLGAAFGAYGGIQALAAIAGPLLGGLLMSANVWHLGWHAIFWVNVPIGLLTLVVGWRVLPESADRDRARLDLVGAVLLALALLAILLPIGQGRSWGWPAFGWVLLGCGLLGLGGFVAYERRVDRPVLNPLLLRNRAFARGLAASAAFFAGLAAFFLLLSVYLQNGIGHSALATGLITVPYATGSLLASGAGIKLARYGRRLPIIGSLVIAVSHLLMWLVVTAIATPTWWQIGIPLFVGGLGLGLAAPQLVNVVLAGVPGREAGAAGGVLSTVNQVAGSAGVAALGAVFFAHATIGGGFASILPWQAGLYVVSALLMTKLALP
jgi:EmrB/QacA subfamily drug resistance transporter